MVPGFSQKTCQNIPTDEISCSFTTLPFFFQVLKETSRMNLIISAVFPHHLPETHDSIDRRRHTCYHRQIDKNNLRIHCPQRELMYMVLFYSHQGCVCEFGIFPRVHLPQNVKNPMFIIIMPHWKRRPTENICDIRVSR